MSTRVEFREDVAAVSIDWNPPPKYEPIPRAEPGEFKAFSLQSGGQIDTEEMYDERTDEFIRRRGKAKCPHCGVQTAPLLSPYTRVLHAGWRWVGLDYQELYTQYGARCRRCKTQYKFTTYSPQ